MMVLIRTLNDNILNIMIEYRHTVKIYGYYTIFCTIQKHSIEKSFRIVTQEADIIENINKADDYDTKQMIYHKNYFEFFEPIIKEWLN